MSDIHTDLTGKVAFVTGASSGIGQGVALALAAEGVKVGVVARRADRLAGLVQQIEAAGGQALALPADVTDRATLTAAATRLKDTFGSIDILFNNAGTMPVSDIDQFKVDEWDQMVDINIKGVLNGVAAVLPQMIQQHAGHIINVSSIAGRRIFGQGFTVYSATKYAVAAFTEGLRMEIGPTHNIRVTAISPSMVQSELSQGTSDPELREAMAANPGGHTMITPAQFAENVVFALKAPAHVNVADLFVLPITQA